MDSMEEPEEVVYYKELLYRKENDGKWYEYYATLKQFALVFNGKTNRGKNEIQIVPETDCAYGEKTDYRFPFWMQIGNRKYNFKCETKTQRFKWMYAIRLCASGEPPHPIPTNGAQPPGYQRGRRSTRKASQALGVPDTGRSRSCESPGRRKSCNVPPVSPVPSIKLEEKKRRQTTTGKAPAISANHIDDDCNGGGVGGGVVGTITGGSIVGGDNGVNGGSVRGIGSENGLTIQPSDDANTANGRLISLDVHDTAPTLTLNPPPSPSPTTTSRSESNTPPQADAAQMLVPEIEVTQDDDDDNKNGSASNAGSKSPMCRIRRLSDCGIIAAKKLLRRKSKSYVEGIDQVGKEKHKSDSHTPNNTPSKTLKKGLSQDTDMTRSDENMHIAMSIVNSTAVVAVRWEPTKSNIANVAKARDIDHNALAASLGYLSHVSNDDDDGANDSIGADADNTTDVEKDSSLNHGASGAANIARAADVICVDIGNSSAEQSEPTVEGASSVEPNETNDNERMARDSEEKQENLQKENSSVTTETEEATSSDSNPNMNNEESSEAGDTPNRNISSPPANHLHGGGVAVETTC